MAGPRRLHSAGGFTLLLSFLVVLGCVLETAGDTDNAPSAETVTFGSLLDLLRSADKALAKVRDVQAKEEAVNEARRKVDEATVMPSPVQKEVGALEGDLKTLGQEWSEGVTLGNRKTEMLRELARQYATLQSLLGKNNQNLNSATKRIRAEDSKLMLTEATMTTKEEAQRTPDVTEDQVQRKVGKLEAEITRLIDKDKGKVAVLLSMLRDTNDFVVDPLGISNLWREGVNNLQEAKKTQKYQINLFTTNLERSQAIFTSIARLKVQYSGEKYVIDQIKMAFVVYFKRIESIRKTFADLRTEFQAGKEQSKKLQSMLERMFNSLKLDKAQNAKSQRMVASTKFHASNELMFVREHVDRTRNEYTLVETKSKQAIRAKVKSAKTAFQRLIFEYFSSLNRSLDMKTYEFDKEVEAMSQITIQPEKYVDDVLKRLQEENTFVAKSLDDQEGITLGYINTRQSEALTQITAYVKAISKEYERDNDTIQTELKAVRDSMEPQMYRDMDRIVKIRKNQEMINMQYDSLLNSMKTTQLAELGGRLDKIAQVSIYFDQLHLKPEGTTTN